MVSAQECLDCIRYLERRIRHGEEFAHENSGNDVGDASAREALTDRKVLEIVQEYHALKYGTASA